MQIPIHENNFTLNLHLFLNNPVGPIEPAAFTGEGTGGESDSHFDPDSDPDSDCDSDFDSEIDTGDGIGHETGSCTGIANAQPSKNIQVTEAIPWRSEHVRIIVTDLCGGRWTIVLQGDETVLDILKKIPDAIGMQQATRRIESTLILELCMC